MHNAGAPRKTGPVDVCGSRILLINDNEVNRSVLLERLDSWKFDAKAAPSGREGIAILNHAAQADRSIDLVILDDQLPDMNGADLAAAIRANAAISKTPIIMLRSVDDKRNSYLPGDLAIQAQLVKPARAAILFDTMIAVLEDARGAETKDAGSSETIDWLAAGPPAGPTPIRPQAGKGDGKVVVRRGRSDLMILVAEDNEVNQAVMDEILSYAGHSYAIVENGKLALERFKDERPDLVLMDISMPEMDGLEAAKAIREAEREAGDGVRTPIIGLTGHALKGDSEVCIDAGMDDYMSKPISPDALLAKVAEWLEKSGTAGQSQVAGAVT